jgi:hypothetical protein
MAAGTVCAERPLGAPMEGCPMRRLSLTRRLSDRRGLGWRLRPTSASIEVRKCRPSRTAESPAPVATTTALVSAVLAVVLAACGGGAPQNTAAASNRRSLRPTVSSSSPKISAVSATPSPSTPSTTPSPTPLSTTLPPAVSAPAPAVAVLVVYGHFLGGSDYAIVRPVAINFGFSVNTEITAITWDHWTDKAADGHGLQLVDSCVPDCASAGVSKVPATLVLSAPVDGMFTTLTESWNGRTQTLSAQGLVEGADPASARVPLPAGSPVTTLPTVPSTVPLKTATGAGEFLSPSGNIACEIDFGGGGTADRVFCLSFSPPRSVTMSPDGSFRTCTGIDCTGNPGENTPTLSYGASTGVGPFKCVSAASGITCTASGKGFEISRTGVTAVG